MKVLIIGGVAAGTKTAAKVKREDPMAQVTLVTKSADVSYAGCGLPYYVGDVIHDKTSLIVNTPQSFSELTGVEVVTLTEAVAVDRAGKSVTVKNVVSGEMSAYAYDKLVIATGASPVTPPVEGVDLEGVYYMRTPADAIAVREKVDSGKVKRAVVVGAGFIGLEVAENLAARGIMVSVIDMAPQILPGFDPEMAGYAENWLADHDIMCFTNTKLEAILGEGHVEKVKTGRRAMKADMVILSAGIRPNTEFLADSGIELWPNRTVKVNEYLQTNDEDIYALGDCATVTNRITGQPAWSPMGSSANIEGRIAAQNICGAKLSYPGVLGTAVAKLPELNVGRTGLNEADAIAAGFDVETLLCVADDKASYYPDFGHFIMKLVVDKNTERLLGLQVLGKGAVDKIVDIAVMAISMKATLSDMENLDFAYAPPFSTAIHPLSMAINVLKNKLSGRMDSITPAQYQAGAAEGYTVIDLGKTATIDGASFVELKDVKPGFDALPKDKPLLLVCTRGRRAYMSQVQLKASGYENTKVLEGGLTFNTIEEE